MNVKKLSLESNDIHILNEGKFYFPIILASLILGFRYDVGVDFNTYEYIFYHQDNPEVFHDIPEFAFQYIYRTIYNLGGSFYITLTILNFISFYFLYKGIKLYRANKWIILFLFLSGQLFLYLNIMRQGIAFFILIYALYQFDKKNYIKYCLFTIIAWGFHFSALLFFSLPIIVKFRKILSHHIFILIVICAFILCANRIFNLFLDFIIKVMAQTHYGRYGTLLTSWEMTEGSGVGEILRTMSALIVFSLLPKLREFYNEKIDNLLLLYLIGILLSLMFGNSLLLSRISFIFISFQFIVLGLLLNYLFSIKKISYQLFGISLTLIYVTYFCGMIILHNNDCSPYQFCF